MLRLPTPAVLGGVCDKCNECPLCLLLAVKCRLVRYVLIANVKVFQPDYEVYSTITNRSNLLSCI